MPRFRRLPIMLLIAILTLGPAADGALARPAPPPPSAQPTATCGLSVGQVQLGARPERSHRSHSRSSMPATERPAVHPRAGRHGARVPDGALVPGIFLDIWRRVRRLQHRWGARPAGPRLPPVVRDQPQVVRVLHATAPATSSSREFTANAGGTSWNGLDRRSMLIAHRALRAEQTTTAGSCCSGPTATSTSSPGTAAAAATRTRTRRTSISLLGKVLRVSVPDLARRVDGSIRQPVRLAVGWRRSGTSGSGTRGGPASTGRPATCGSATSARAPGRRSTASPPNAGGTGGTGAGATARARTLRARGMRWHPSSGIAAD